MKYRIVSIRKTKRKTSSEIIPFRENTAIEIKMGEDLPSSYGELFGFGIFSEVGSDKPRKKKTVFRGKAKKCLSAFGEAFRRIRLELRNRIMAARKKRMNRPSKLPMLSGALCASILIALISGSFVIYRIFFPDTFKSFYTVTIPDLVGTEYSEGTQLPEHCAAETKYVYSSEIKKGVIITQTPSAGVVRRVYKDDAPCPITLTISLGERTFVMEDLTSLSQRDALLILKNNSLRFSLRTAYSDDAEKNTVISTDPPAGVEFTSEDTVILTVSLGPKIKYCTVPNIVGMSESLAISKLKGAGLSVGKIEYIASDTPLGTVISQSEEAYFSLPQQSAVSFTVSAGNRFQQRLMPDLFGLRLSEAKEKLSRVGLVCGHIFAVANGAPSGVVVSQSVPPNTPIVGGMTSVDLYVSS